MAFLTPMCFRVCFLELEDLGICASPAEGSLGLEDFDQFSFLDVVVELRPIGPRAELGFFRTGVPPSMASFSLSSAAKLVTALGRPRDDRRGTRGANGCQELATVLHRLIHRTILSD